MQAVHYHPDHSVILDSTVSNATGTKYHKSEPVYPAQPTEWEADFPDGTPIIKDQKPDYVFVWKTRGECKNVVSYLWNLSYELLRVVFVGQMVGVYEVYNCYKCEKINIAM